MHSNFGTTQLFPLNGVNSQSKTPGLKKYATLSPYITEIQKRKKTRSVLRENRCRSRNKNQNSSKSFRIKQKSASSLHDTSIVRNKKDESIKYILDLVNKASSNTKNQNTLNIKRKNSKDQKERQNSGLKNNLTQKHRNISKRNTVAKQVNGLRNINNSQAQNRQQIKYFNSKRQQIQRRDRKQLSFRKNMYESKSKVQISPRDKQKQTIQVCRHGYTDQNRNHIERNKDLKKVTADLIPEKKKFRRNKYEALYSSVNSNQARQQKNKAISVDPIKSESQLQFGKKQSNVSINKQMDRIAENEIRKFYRQMRSKQIEKSIQKSTQKYFKQNSSYRALKSNNDIESNYTLMQVYVSTVKNPSLNRQSNTSTLNTSDQQNQPSVYKNTLKQNNFLQYQFDFKDPENHQFQGITQIENPSQQESMQMIEQQTSFERQRKEVEKQYFHKQSPQVQWSDEDCQIDQL